MINRNQLNLVKDCFAEIDGEIICLKHHKPIEMMNMDKSIPIANVLLCSDCFKMKRTVSNNIISFFQGKQIITEQCSQSAQKQFTQNLYINELQGFQEKLKDIQSQVNEITNEIFNTIQLWIDHILQIPSNLLGKNFLEEFEYFYQNCTEQNLLSSRFEQISQGYFLKINLIFDKLNFEEKLFKCQNNIVKFMQQNQKYGPQMDMNSIPQDQRCITTELVNQVSQQNFAYALSFNYDGSIMVSSSTKDIIVWQFVDGQLSKLQTLIGHFDNVTCLLFSKKYNWLTSGSEDNSIQCWKQLENNNWVNFKSSHLHKKGVGCMIMNAAENELTSGSERIKIWKIDSRKNQVVFDYDLPNTENEYIQCVSLNDSETALVSCSSNQQITLWGRGDSGRWQYKDHVKQDDFGFRICFLNDNSFIWQQQLESFSYVFSISKWKLKSEASYYLPSESSDVRLFPTIFNKRKQIIIQKYNAYVFIIQLQSNGELIIESEPINCQSKYSYGGLTNDGQYLVIWNMQTHQFRIYKLQEKIKEVVQSFSN